MRDDILNGDRPLVYGRLEGNKVYELSPLIRSQYVYEADGGVMRLLYWTDLHPNLPTSLRPFVRPLQPHVQARLHYLQRVVIGVGVPFGEPQAMQMVDLRLKGVEFAQQFGTVANLVSMEPEDLFWHVFHTSNMASLDDLVDDKEQKGKFHTDLISLGRQALDLANTAWSLAEGDS